MNAMPVIAASAPTTAVPAVRAHAAAVPRRTSTTEPFAAALATAMLHGMPVLEAKVAAVATGAAGRETDTAGAATSGDATGSAATPATGGAQPSGERRAPAASVAADAARASATTAADTPPVTDVRLVRTPVAPERNRAVTSDGGNVADTDTEERTEMTARTGAALQAASAVPLLTARPAVPTPAGVAIPAAKATGGVAIASPSILSLEALRTATATASTARASAPAERIDAVTISRVTSGSPVLYVPDRATGRWTTAIAIRTSAHSVPGEAADWLAMAAEARFAGHGAQRTSAPGTPQTTGGAQSSTPAPAAWPAGWKLGSAAQAGSGSAATGDRHDIAHTTAPADGSMPALPSVAAPSRAGDDAPSSGPLTAAATVTAEAAGDEPLGEWDDGAATAARSSDATPVEARTAAASRATRRSRPADAATDGRRPVDDPAARADAATGRGESVKAAPQTAPARPRPAAATRRTNELGTHATPCASTGASQPASASSEARAVPPASEAPRGATFAAGEARTEPTAAVRAETGAPAIATDGVTLQLPDPEGGNTRIRVDVRGDTVRARIVPQHPELAGRLTADVDDVRAGLGRQGFSTATVSIRTPPATTGRESVAAASDGTSVSPAGRSTDAPPDTRQSGRDAGDGSARDPADRHGSRPHQRSARERER